MNFVKYKELLKQIQYLSRGVVFAIDLTIVVLSTFYPIYLFNHGLVRDNAASNDLVLLICSVVAGSILLYTSGSYRTIIRHTTLKEVCTLIYLIFFNAVIMTIVLVVTNGHDLSLAFMYFIRNILFGSFLMVFYRAFLANLYYWIINTNTPEVANALICGTDHRASLLVDHINSNIHLPYKVVGLLTDDPGKKGLKISGVKVCYLDGCLRRLNAVVAKQKVTHMIFPSNTIFKSERDRVVDYCIENNIQMLMVGELKPVEGKNEFYENIKPIEIEDLLQRNVIEIDIEAVSKEVAGKTVLVSGAAGSIGSEIAFQLAQLNVGRLLLVDSAETPLHNLQLKMNRLFPEKQISFILGSVTSRTKMEITFAQHRPQLIFHAAAYKHVPMIERYPCEGVITNVSGTINLSELALKYEAEKFVMISTDKAVNPTNVMGATKRIAELWIHYFQSKTIQTQFITTRFGNVLGSNGSVIPLFREQIARGGPVTVTHPEITRYFMTIPEACRLVMQAVTMGKEGRVFVFDMGEQVKIINLAKRMILLSGLVPDQDIKIEFTGLRPGEKLYEELLTDIELTEATQNNKIRIAQVEHFDNQQLETSIRQLIEVANRFDIQQTVALMKKIVPEFISNNSHFEVLDN